jgi:hypothetical protein
VLFCRTETEVFSCGGAQIFKRLCRKTFGYIAAQQIDFAV